MSPVSKDFRRKVKSYLRTHHPTRYSLINFGLSRRYEPTSGHPSTYPSRVVTSRPPEHEDGMTPCNPSPIDVYHLGNLIREYTCRFVRCSLLTYRADGWIQKYKGFEFMEHLVTDMVQNDPTKRPTMDEVVTRFSEIRGDLNTWKLRSVITRRYGQSLPEIALPPAISLVSPVLG